MTTEQDGTSAFIERWQGITASELSTAQSFVIELCELLGVPRPHATAEQDYMFERPVTFQHGDGSSSAGRIDCYRRGAFIWESKKLKPGRQISAGAGASASRSRCATLKSPPRSTRSTNSSGPSGGALRRARISLNAAKAM